MFLVGSGALSSQRRQPTTQNQPDEVIEQNNPTQLEEATTLENPSFRRYRMAELERVLASLRANSSILVVGEEGSGKSVLADAVVEALTDEGFTVVEIDITTLKYMLKDVADQLGVPTVEAPMDPKTKVLTLDQLQKRLEEHFEKLQKNKEVVFLVVDDAHKCNVKFRDWLKTLKRQGIPMFLTATNPPRSDIFLNLPRIELAPLPDYCIREIMEQAAMERGLPLQPSVLANLQQRAGGNPMLAQRAVNEEYLGIDNEAGDHNHYFDISPLLVLVGVFFMASKFLARGLNDPSLYVISAISGAVFMGISRLFYSLPKESKRIG